MGCGMCCMKCILILVNVFFGLIGLVLLGGGIFLKVGASKILNTMLGPMLQSLPSIPSLLGMTGTKAAPSGTLNLDFGVILESAATALIVIGVFLVVVSILGGCGSCCSNRVFLIIYAVVLLILFLAQVILVILLFTGGLDSMIKNNLQTTIDKQYKGIDDFTVWSLAWNFIMIDRKCCGINNYNDFATAANWKKDRTFTVAGVTKTVTLKTPVACCKFTGTFPLSAKPVSKTCAYTPTPLDSNMQQGCFAAVVQFMDTYNSMAVGIAAGIIVFQLLVAVFAIVIVYLINKDKEQMV